MRFTFDPDKAAANLVKHGVDFAEVEGFGWEVALVRADVRFGYGEVRLVALAPIGDRLFSLIYTIETRSVRLISLRPASKKEFRLYVSEA